MRIELHSHDYLKQGILQNNGLTVGLPRTSLLKHTKPQVLQGRLVFVLDM